MRNRKWIQPNNRSYSEYHVLGRQFNDICCDCGLVHSNQLRVEMNERTRTVKVFMRSRRNIKLTKQRRAK